MAMTMKTLSVRPAARQSGAVARAASRPLWCPGITPPAHLNGSLPADYGFDPLGLAADPDALNWYVQAELVHGRFAMLATAGILIPGALIPGFPQWFEAGEKALASSPFPYATLVAIEIFMMGWAEGRRWMDIKNPGSQADDWFMGLEGNFKGEAVGYPGGFFNPMGMGKGDEKMKAKEIANGRLAMLSFIGYVSQYYATGKGPLQNLSDHLANPWSNNFATNGVSLPGFPAV